MSQQPVTADPATLAIILQRRVNSGEASHSERAYVQHWNGCFQCFTAPGEATMCSLGKHLYHKLQYREGEGE